MDKCSKKCKCKENEQGEELFVNSELIVRASDELEQTVAKDLNEEDKPLSDIL